MEINGKKRYFRLEKDEDGEISLIATNKNGALLENGYVLTIREEGIIDVMSSLTGRSGLKRNKEGYATVSES